MLTFEYLQNLDYVTTKVRTANNSLGMGNALMPQSTNTQITAKSRVDFVVSRVHHYLPF